MDQPGTSLEPVRTHGPARNQAGAIREPWTSEEPTRNQLGVRILYVLLDVVSIQSGSWHKVRSFESKYPEGDLVEGLVCRKWLCRGLRVQKGVGIKVTYTRSSTYGWVSHGFRKFLLKDTECDQLVSVIRCYWVTERWKQILLANNYFASTDSKFFSMQWIRKWPSWNYHCKLRKTRGQKVTF